MTSKFIRFEKLIGSDKLNLLKKKNIIVIGVGGVGGYVVEALIRSGISSITIVDDDIIDESNINRQIIALESTIGRKKIEVFKERILDINKDVLVTVKDMYLDNDNLDVLNLDEYDFIIDACDSINTKKALIDYATSNNLSIISSMGTAKKIDSSKLEIVDIRKTINDPLARIIRKHVKDNRIKKKVMVLSSTEVPIKLDENVLGSTAFVPSVAGLMIAGYVIRKLIEDK